MNKCHYVGTFYYEIISILLHIPKFYLNGIYFVLKYNIIVLLNYIYAYINDIIYL